MLLVCDSARCTEYQTESLKGHSPFLSGFHLCGLEGVSVKRGVGMGPGTGIGVYFFFKECCLSVRVGVKKTLTIPNGSPS